jgi:broad-specificity NMP kinase
MKTIYLVSGPLGAGKTSLSKYIAQASANCVFLDGDALFFPLDTISRLSWEERLQLTWENILSVTRNYVKADCDVVIDLVIEGELQWFIKSVSDLDVQIKYIVLVADEKTLAEQLEKRGEPQYLGRSLDILKKQLADPANQPYFFDATHKSTVEIAEEFLSSNRFLVSK